MIFKVFNEIFEKYEGLKIGVIVVKDIHNEGSDNKIHHLLYEIENLIRLEFTPEELTKIELIKEKKAKARLISAWRAAYEDFGAKPIHYKTSFENLMNVVLSGENIPKSNKLVDCCNYLALKHFIPISCTDLNKIDGDLFLGFAAGEEWFKLAKNKKEHPEEKEVIYSDSSKVLFRRWNWKQSQDGIVGKNTKNAIIFIDALPPVTTEQLKPIMKEAKELVEMFCKGKVSCYVVDEKNPQIEVR